MRTLLTGAVALAVLFGCSDADRTPTGPELAVPVLKHAGVQHSHRAHLSGADEVPPVPTRATGQALFKLQDDGTITYKLIVANIRNVTMAHIHIGGPGDVGDPIVWLYPSGPPPQLIPGRTQGVLAEGVITDADLVGPLVGQTVADLLDEIRSGNTYVNVHTSQFPGGEIRGQIR